MNTCGSTKSRVPAVAMIAVAVAEMTCLSYRSALGESQTQWQVGLASVRIAAYCNDFFGYLPTAMVLEEGGYETRGLIGEIGYFAPEAERVLVAKVQELARKAGRKGP